MRIQNQLNNNEVFCSTWLTVASSLVGEEMINMEELCQQDQIKEKLRVWNKCDAISTRVLLIILQPMIVAGNISLNH
jgi:hypothetical protein